MDCCQLEKNIQGVKQEVNTADPDNGPPDADTPGGSSLLPHHRTRHTEAPSNAKPSLSPVSDCDVTNSTQLNDAELPHTASEPNSPIPAKRLKNRKQTIDCNDKNGYEDKRKFSIKGSAIFIAKCDIKKNNSSLPEAMTDSTEVRDLEKAVWKHFPSVAPGGKETHQPTDFSTNTLLKQQQQKSHIQCIGTQNLNNLNRHAPGKHMAPASTLLKQLYANRESVIRSNFLGDGRTGYSSGDIHSGPLPTPPGSDGSGYGDQLGHKRTDAYGSYTDYHSTMTPPGSVSPKDTQQYPLLYENSAYSEALRHSYLGEASLPLRPQAYSAVIGAMDYASSLDQSQFLHPSPFHLYHP